MAVISTFLQFREALGREQTMWIRVGGDMTSAERVTAAARKLRRACATSRRVVVDAAGVIDADTKFVAVLVDVRRRASEAEVELVVLPSAPLRRWVTICRLETLLR